MSAGAPWSVKGIDPKAREVAKDLARRSGMTLGEWLNHVILEDDLPDEITVETQFTERRQRALSEAPRLTAVPPTSDMARIAFSLDRLTDRIESSETRTGLAINSVEHSVRQAIARIESAEREQHASALRVDNAIAEFAAEQSQAGQRLRRLESDAGPRSAEALRALEARISEARPDVQAESVLERLSARLAAAETRTAEAVGDLRQALSILESRVGAVETGSDAAKLDLRFEALGDLLSRRVDAVRDEVAQTLAAAAGPQVEARLAAMAETIRIAERRSSQAVEAIGRQVLAMADAVGRKLSDVDDRSAEAIDQVGSEVARIAGAVELRLARGEQAQAQAFEQLRTEVSRVADHFTPAPIVTDGQTDVVLAPPPEPEPEPPVALDVEADDPATTFEEDPSIAQLLADARARFVASLDTPQDADRPAPPDENSFERGAPEPFSQVATIDAPWRRLDVDVPEGDIPGVFAPINEGEDEDLFAPTAASDRPGAELSTRQVIDRARAAARASGPGDTTFEMRATVAPKTATGRFFQGFGARPKPRARQNAGLQTALMVAGGAAFLSVGAAGLTLMQGRGGTEARQADVSPVGTPARVAVARTLPNSPAVYAQVRREVETGAPGGVARLKALAEAGHPQALLYLAQLHELGEAGFSADPVEARRLITLAAESGDPQAMHNLGVYYFRGEGGALDLASAAQWFRKAATAGVVESQYNLGLLYQSGSGVTRDLAQAREWFAKAAAQGDAEARRALALLPAEHKQRALASSGASPLLGTSPVGASQNVRQTQLILARLGYYAGPADGLANAEYRIALADYQRDLDASRVAPRPYVAQR